MANAEWSAAGALANVKVREWALSSNSFSIIIMVRGKIACYFAVSNNCSITSSNMNGLERIEWCPKMVIVVAQKCVGMLLCSRFAARDLLLAKEKIYIAPNKLVSNWFLLKEEEEKIEKKNIMSHDVFWLPPDFSCCWPFYVEHAFEVNNDFRQIQYINEFYSRDSCLRGCDEKYVQAVN